jgi:hypothetical protein
LELIPVTAQRVIWFSILFTSLYYLVVGLFLALGYDIGENSSNVLNSILEFGLPRALSKLTVGMFSFVMLLPGNPCKQ